MKVKLALTGFGNVGQGLATLLAQHGDAYAAKYGVRIVLSAAVDRQGAAIDPNGLDPELLLRSKLEVGTVADYPGGVVGLAGDAVLHRAGAHVLVEAASTNFQDAEPGWGYARAALERDMDLVLASKGSLALHWDELFRTAREKGLHVLFSATVGAPLPSLDIAFRSLVGTEITGFEGIVNGTTHQILTAMSQGLTYDEGVRQAQEIGIAETDPTLDVDGWDAVAKTAILSNAIFGTELRISDVRREGIRGVSDSDLKDAARNGEAIKLIASVTRRNGRVEADVRPRRRPLNHPLGRLSGDAMGLVFFVEPLGQVATTVEGGGHGGGISTAMTVLRDVLNLARDRGWDRDGLE